VFARNSLKDLLAGLIFMGFGLAFGYASLNYSIGTALRMGPGYFPLLLSGLMVLLGIVITVQSFFVGADETPLGRVPWLGLVLIIGALVFFGLTVRGLGLAPALFVTTFLSAYASERTGILEALALAAGLVAVSMVIFVWALGLPLRMVGPWLNPAIGGDGVYDTMQPLLFGAVGALAGLAIGWGVTAAVYGGGRHLDPKLRSLGVRASLGVIAVGFVIVGAWIGASLG
jgi:hypothetical protein